MGTVWRLLNVKRRKTPGIFVLVAAIGLAAAIYIAVRLPYSKLHYLALFSGMYSFDRRVGVRGPSNGRVHMLYGFNAPKSLYKKGLRYEVSFNNVGFRHREPAPEEAGMEGWRENADCVLCIGDSILFGQDVPQERTIPATLERILSGTRNGDAPIRAWNAALPGHNTTNVWLKARHYLPRLQPRALVLSASYNDRNAACTYTNEAKELFYTRLLGGMSGRQAFLRSLGMVARGKIGWRCDPTVRVPPALCADRFREILVLAGNIPVVVLTTWTFKEDAYRPLRDVFAEFANVRTLDVQEFLQEQVRRRTWRLPRFANDVATVRRRLVDPTKVDWEYILAVTSDRSHPNEIGATLLAEEIARFIQSLWPDATTK